MLYFKNLFLFHLFLVFCSGGYAQITFEKNISSTNSIRGKSIYETDDGGFMIGGTELVKIDSVGDVSWTKPYSSQFASPTFDGGAILVETESKTIYFTKVDSSGNLLWQTSNNDGHWNNEGICIQQTHDSGFILTGTYQSVTGSGMLLMKLNSQGGKEWRKTFTESTSAGFNTGYTVKETADNGFVLAGFTYQNYYDSTKNKDVIIVKTDSHGNEEWRKYFGGDEDDVAFAVTQDANGDYLIAGRNNSLFMHGSSKMYLIKLDTNGDSLWTKTYGGMFMEAATGIDVTNDGGYVISGSSNTFSHGDFDGYVVKVNVNGDTLWTKNFGTVGVESLNSVKQTSDGGFVMVGSTHLNLKTSIYVVKTDGSGNILGSNNGVSNNTSAANMKVYPNPAQGQLVIQIPDLVKAGELEIRNIAGQIIRTVTITNEITTVNTDNLMGGYYVLRFPQNGVITTKKVLIIP